MRKWAYGKIMQEQGDIEIKDWSDEKEYALRKMDEEYDYLWNEKDGEYEFIDRLYSCNIEDEIVRERIKRGEERFKLKKIEEVIKWIKNKEKEDEGK